MAMLKKIKDIIGKIWFFLKSKWKKVLIGTGIVAVATAATETLILPEPNRISIEALNQHYGQAARIKNIYQLKDSALVMSDRSGMQIEVGERNLAEFSPTLVFDKFNNKAQFKVIPDLTGIPRKNKSFNFEDNKIKFGTPRIDYLFYDIPGGYETEIILKQKPITNQVSFNIETKSLSFRYYPIEPKCVETPTTTECSYVPEELAGSYLVTANIPDNYSEPNSDGYHGVGMFRIYRPKVTDSVGKETWGEMNIDEQAGLMTIAISQDFLDKAVYPVTIDPKYEYYDTGEDADFSIYDSEWKCQTFTPSTAHTMTKVVLKVMRTGSPSGNMDVSIQETTGGEPNGSELCSGSVSAGSLVEGTTTWTDINVGSGCDLSASTQYAIMVSCPSADGFDYCEWGLDITSPTYTGGQYGGSSDSGANWTMNSARDFLFEEWGAAPDTCTCPDPAADWQVHSGDNCFLDSNCYLAGKTLYLVETGDGTGTFNITSNGRLTVGEIQTTSTEWTIESGGEINFRQ